MLSYVSDLRLKSCSLFDLELQLKIIYNIDQKVKKYLHLNSWNLRILTIYS